MTMTGWFAGAAALAALATAGVPGSARAAETASSPGAGDASTASEVIVTAQKREENLHDVPVPVSVVQAQALTQTNQVALRDFFTSIPGVTLQPVGFSQQNITIRGLDTGGGDPTVAIMLDGLPFGGSTGPTLGGNLPDLDPDDLSRIEILRGPQGTLYGAESMGGLVNYVTIDPSTAGFSGRFQAGTSSVYNGAEPGFQVRAAVNVPLSQTLAIRVSGFKRQEPGYVDNPVLGVRGVNEIQADGARISALWTPLPDVSLRLSALYQHTSADGYPDSVPSPSLSALQQNYIPGPIGYAKRVQAYSAILKAHLGSIGLVSNTGLNIENNRDALDFSYGFGSLTQLIDGVGGSIYTGEDRSTKFTQELRLNGSALHDRVDWLVGAFYTRESNPHNHQFATAEDPITGKVVDPTFWDFHFSGSYREYAGFADLTYRISDKLDIQFGGRESHINTQFSEVSTGTLYGGAVVVDPSNPSSATVFTYLVTPRFRLTPDWMIYARFASGFRPGGPNTGARPAGVPPQSDPDQTRNYELGAKANLLEGRLTLDASLYYIDWSDIQVNFVDPTDGFNFTANGGHAKSEGVELSVSARPASHTTISGWVAYDDAVLTSDFPAGSSVEGLKGDRLPTDPRWSGHIAANQDFDLPHDLTLFVSGRWSYVGKRLGTFVGAGTARDVYPAYTKLDLSVGLRNSDWTVTLYLNNVADERGIVGVGTTPGSIVYITPRTVGVSVTRRF
jgi:outer membrane receptor protein involved in Fe transport